MQKRSSGRGEIKLVSILTLIPSIFWLGSHTSETSYAQENEKILVFVENATDAGIAERLGGNRSRVEQIATEKVGTSGLDQLAESSRLLRLGSLHLYFVRVDEPCPVACLWRERLARENPRGLIKCLPNSRSSQTDDWLVEAEQVVAIYYGLIAVLPDHREDLESNLRRELRRARELALETPRLAVIQP